MQVTQVQVDSLETWIENRKEAYLRKGFQLAAEAGTESLAEFKDGSGLTEADQQKSLADIKAELESAEEFHKDARQILFAGRQGG